MELFRHLFYDGTAVVASALAWQVGNPGAVQRMYKPRTNCAPRAATWCGAMFGQRQASEAHVQTPSAPASSRNMMAKDQPCAKPSRACGGLCDRPMPAGLTDFYGLQALARRAMPKAGNV